MLTKLIRWWHGRDVDRRIRKHGWTAIYVGDYASSPTWTYTIGLKETLGQAEVVIFDIPQASANELLWTIFDEMKQGKLVPEDGKPWHPEEWDARFVWRKVDPSQVESADGWFTLAAMRRCLVKEEAPVFQLVLADENQRLPWEPGYNEALRVRQPALYLPLTDYGDAPLSAPEREALRIADERGWSIMRVGGDLQWAYTIGRVEAGAPELVCFLPTADGAARVLDDAMAHIARGDLVLADGTRWTGPGFECCWRRVHESQYLALGVFRLAKLRHEARIGRREAVAAYQAFIPDDQERYPWEPGCHPGVRDCQPLLFEPFDPHTPKRGPLATLTRM